MICDACGASVALGAWPWCPHDTGASNIQDVTWPGGKTFENLANEPVTFYHRSEYDRYLKTHRIEECVRHVPLPGSDKSPHTQSWALMDPQTLANAEALVARSGAARDLTPETWIQSMTVTVSEITERVHAPRGTFDVS